ncbi:MAG: cell wall hydrolase [Oscillospiraceae bacterium]|nr:cell wall hydrolase [Oscillospiraceae bacterium]
MKKRWSVGLLAAVLIVSLATPAQAAVNAMRVDGRDVWQEAKTERINGTHYVSLRTMAGLLAPEAAVSWRDGAGWVEGEGISLRAKPGDRWLTFNDRAFYIPDGVVMRNGSVLVPVRAVAAALGAEVDWSREKGVTVTSGNGRPKSRPYRDDELYWMSKIISAESQGEPLEGKLAVGTVVLNRVASREFPNTIYGVIFDRKWGVQFQPTANGMIYKDPTAESVLAAKMVLEGARVAGNSLYFLAPALTNNHWIMENRTFVTTIGVHWFYQ